MNLDFAFLDWGVISSFIAKGFIFSFQLTLVAMVGGIIIGTLLALMRLSGNARLYGFGCQLRDFAKRAHLVALRMQTDAYRARSTKNHGALLAALRGPHPDEVVAQHQAQRRRGEEALVGVVEKFHLTSL